MRPAILLLSAGRRVALLEGIRAAATRLLSRPRILAADMRPDLSAACHCADEAFFLPQAGAAEYSAALKDLCAREEVGLVIPTIDTELPALARLRPVLAAQGTAVVISDPWLVDTCRDKRQVADLFRQLDLPTPALFPPDAVRFPCFSKPASGSSSQGAFRIDRPEAITPAMRNDPDRIYMELVPSDYREVTVDLYYDRQHMLRAVVPRERIETRAGEVSKGRTRRDWLIGYLHERLDCLDGARGCLTLQLFLHPGQRDVRAIEINPRFGGGYPLALAAGADFPEWLIREYLLDETIDYFDGWEADLTMLRYDAQVLVRGI